MRRLMTATGLIVLMLSAIGPTMMAQTPEASPVATPVETGGAWQITDVQQVDVDALIFSLSPDGQWLAGRADREFCVWDVETLAPRCVDPGAPILADTVAWAPDSSAVAFSQLGLGQMQVPGGSDILVFNVADGVLRNLTDPDEGIATPAAGNQTRIDVYPAWSPDGDELVFERLQGVEDQETTIMRISRDGAEPETVVNTGHVAVGPQFWVADDRIVYSALGPAESDKGIWEVGLDGGAPRHIMPGGTSAEVHKPVLVDVAPDGSWFTVYAGDFFGSQDNDHVFGVVNSQTGEVQTFGFGPNPTSEPDLLTPPRFSPDEQWLAALVFDDFGASSSTLGFWKPGSGGPSMRIRLGHAYAPVSALPIGLPWAENGNETMLLLQRPGGSGVIIELLTLERNS